MTNTTTFFILPATITSQEMLDFEEKIAKKLGILNESGNPYNTNTLGHSNFTKHPTNGTYIYDINGHYQSVIGSEQPAYRPVANFATAIDDVDHTKTQVKALGFFSDEEV